MIEFMAAVLMATPAAQQEEPRLYSEALELSFLVPVDWTRRRIPPPSIVRFDDPSNQAQLVVAVQPVDYPVAMAGFLEQLRKYLTDNFPGAQFLEERTAHAETWPVQIMPFLHNGRFHYVAAVQRSLLEFYVIRANCPELDRVNFEPEFDRVATSFRWQRADPDERARNGLRRVDGWRVEQTAVPPSLAAEQTLEMYRDQARIGTYHLTVQPEEVRGGPGVRYQVEITVEGAAEETMRSRSTGTFRLDLSFQSQRIEETYHVAGLERAVILDAEALDGHVRISRRVEEWEEGRELDLPQPMMLAGTAEVLRRGFAAVGTGEFAFYVLNIAEDEPRMETLEVHAMEEATLEHPGTGERRRLAYIPVVGVRTRGFRPGGGDTTFYFVAPDGKLRMERSSQGRYVMVDQELRQ